jgi:hypothetical protein
MHSTPTAIRLRQDRFEERAKELGLGSNTACAEHIGVDQSTLSRIRNGDVLPGEKFIAACLTSGFAPNFEWLFRLGTGEPVAS